MSPSCSENLRRHVFSAIALLVIMVSMSQFGKTSPGQGLSRSGPWRLTTSDTEIILTTQDGWPVLKAVTSPATAHNWLSSPDKEQLMKIVMLDGKPRNTDWKFEGVDQDAQTGELIFRYSNSSPKLDLKSVWRARPGHGPVEHWITIANNSPNTITMTNQDSLTLDGLTLASDESAQAWWINRGGNTPSLKGGVFTTGINPGLDQVLISNPTNGSSPVPWLAVQDGRERGFYVGWEFSGIGRIHVKTIAEKPTRFDLEIGLVPKFKTDIPSGQTFLVPPAFIGCYRGTIDDGSYTLHRFILDKLLPPRPKNQPYPTLAYNLYLDVGGNKARESHVVNSASFSKQLGFETFVPDAMWYPKDGDWRWDPARFPHGEKPIEEYVHQNGMKLGLWVAFTHGGDSDDPGALNIFRHPDWFNEEIGPDWKSHDINWTPLLDLGYKPAREWVEQELVRLVSEYKLDYLKHDHSPIVTQCVQVNHPHHYGVDVSYWSTLGYYQVMEMLHDKFPDLVFEGCSGGGHIKDFGYVKHVHYIVTTDTLSALPDRQSIYDSTFAFPPAVLMAYTYENLYNKTSDRPLPFLWRSAMMSAWQIDPTHTANWSPQEVAGVKRATEIYKSWIRPILNDCEVHHILPRPDGVHWDGLFYWSPSLKRGTVYIFRPNNDQIAQRVRLKGLQANARYQIRSEDGSVAQGVLTGADLMTQGLEIRLPHKYSSDLILVTQSQ